MGHFRIPSGLAREWRRRLRIPSCIPSLWICRWSSVCFVGWVLLAWVSACAEELCRKIQYPATWILGGHVLPPQVVRFSTNGSRLWTGAPLGGLKRWSFPTGLLEETFWFGPVPVQIDFCLEEGLAALVSRNGQLQVIAWSNNLTVTTVSVRGTSSPRLAPDGQHVVVADPLGFSAHTVGSVALGVLRLSDGTWVEPTILTTEGNYQIVEFFDAQEFLAADPGRSLARFRIGQRAPLWQQATGVWPVAVCRAWGTVVGMEGNRPVLFEAQTGVRSQELPSLQNAVTAIACSEGGEAMAFALSDGTVEIRSSPGGTVSDVVPAVPGRIHLLAWSPDGAYLVMVTTEQVWVWNRATGGPARPFTVLAGAIRLEAGLEGKYLVTSQSGGQVTALDAQSGVVRWQQRVGSAHNVGVLTLSPDERWLGIGRRDGAFELWKASDGSWERTVVAFGSSGPLVSEVSVEVLTWSPAGNAVLAVNGSGRLKVFSTLDWNIRAETMIPSLRWAGFSPNGDAIVASLSNGALHMLSAATMESLYEIAEASLLGFRAHGTQVVTLHRSSPPTRVDVWDLVTGGHLHGVELPVNRRTAALSSDGQVILVSDLDGRFSAWELRTGRCLGWFQGAMAVPLNQMRLHERTDGISALRMDGSLVRFEAPLFLQVQREEDSLVFEAMGRAGPFRLEHTPAGLSAWQPTGHTFASRLRLSLRDQSAGWFRVRVPEPVQ